MKQYRDQSDSNLVKFCIEGEQPAWEALVHRYQNLVYTIPRRLGLNATDVEDVFQAVWMQLYANLSSIRDPERLGGWLVITARRESWRVSRRRLPTAEEEEMADMGQWSTSEASTEQVVAQYEQHLRLRTVLEKLNERCRKLLHLLFYDPENPSYETIAAALSIPVGAIGPNRARCLGKLRQELDDSKH